MKCPTIFISGYPSCINRDRPIMLIFYLLCYAAVLIKFTYYAQYYAQEKELCLLFCV